MANPSIYEARFSWRGIDAHGRISRGVLVATDAQAVRAALKRQHIIATEISRKGPVKAGALRAADITLFSRQLASLLQAGLPLLPALEVIAASDTRPPFARMVNTLAHDIASGMHFSSALARHRQFGALYCRLVALGEASGALAALLARLADDRERAAAQKSKLRAALSYPAGILLLALAITAALMIWVVPTFKQIFDDFGAPLPLPTRIVLWLSDAVSHSLAPAAALITAISVALGAGLRRSAALRAAFDRLSLMPPIVGPLLRQLALARWSRALGTLLQAGTPLADAFDIVANVSSNAVFDQATRAIAQRVRRGERLSDAMRAVGCFPIEVRQPIAVAEESGALDTMLNDLAALNDRQIDARIAALANIAEPLIIAVLGVLVGGLVIAMYLPIIQLGNVV